MTREEIKEIFGEVLFNVSVELGRKKVTIGEMLRWESGTIIPKEQLVEKFKDGLYG